MKMLVDLVVEAQEEMEFVGELQVYTKKDIFRLPIKGLIIGDEEWIKLNDESMDRNGTSITSKRVKIIQKLV